MDSTDSLESAADKDEDEETPLSDSFAGVRLSDAPILLFVYFHKAIRAELAELRRAAVVASELGSYDRQLILELLRRFQFLKLVNKYHCATEDEVCLHFFLVAEKIELKKVK